MEKNLNNPDIPIGTNKSKRSKHRSKLNKNHIVLIAIFFSACQVNTERKAVPISQEVSQSSDSITSFLGEELPPKTLTDKVRAKYEENLRIAKSNLDAHPDSLELIIWYGRRMAYLGKYLEAIQIYSDGLDKYPDSYHLLRHRGHRYITTRQLDLAIRDFESAAFNSTNTENAIEPDGIPNRLKRPLSNDKFNIWYHFGLAHYLNGRFDKAVSAYKKCMEYSDNNDLKVATSYWLYLSAKRIGNDDLANETLTNIKVPMRVIENEEYLHLLLLFKEERSIDHLLRLATDADGQINPTLGYGIGNWYIQNGKIDEARNLFWKILESPDWDAFGYIATEADITNMATSVD